MLSRYTHTHTHTHTRARTQKGQKTISRCKWSERKGPWRLRYHLVTRVPRTTNDLGELDRKTSRANAACVQAIAWRTASCFESLRPRKGQAHSQQINKSETWRPITAFFDSQLFRRSMLEEIHEHRTTAAATEKEARGNPEP